MIKRKKYLENIRPFYDEDLIKVITGIRRSGKSTLLEQIINEIKDNENKINELKNELYNLENNNCVEDKKLKKLIREFLELNNPPRNLIVSLIDRIEISEDNNIDIYYKFKLVN